ncbi:epoxide hydrolase family protein [Cryptosporangium japonicum]|uniref:Epoxide hydrolase n=1 Tax=Cryptosporangium japonicum TaxID=80872 RepID=A0ABP3D7L9_9ACTN
MNPFRIAVADAELDRLHARLADARWPSGGPGNDPRRGITAARLAELADHWRTGYDWRAAEAELNRHPQFRTEIDGQVVHFVHVRSGDPDAVALLLTHGYPSSPAEFGRLIDLLTDDFHLVVPSLPGYGFSTPLAGPGATMGRAARLWVELMRRLGYERYGVHGGDVGAGVSGAGAALDPAHVVGVHVVTDPTTAAATATFLPGLADGLDPDDGTDALILERMTAFRTENSGYLAVQNSRPQTIGYALADSPLFQLAWIAEKFDEWAQHPIDSDLLLTTVSLYWFTGCGATAAHTLYDQAHAHDWGGPVTVPQGFAVFGADETVRRLVPAPPDAHWTEFAHGGHFPAMEAPVDLAADLRTFFAGTR